MLGFDCGHSMLLPSNRPLTPPLRFGVEAFYIGEMQMNIEIDMDSVDMDVVSEVLIVITDAMLAADVDPTPDEMFVAIGELMSALADEVMGVGEVMH